MSLLDDGPDTIDVYVEVTVTDEYGNETQQPSDTPVSVRCRVQPGTSDETALFGQQTVTVYRVLSRTFPGGPYARVEWNGDEWDVQGDPKWHSGSPATQHVTTWIKRR